MRQTLRLFLVVLLLIGVAVPVIAHEETEVVVPGGELELKVDRPVVMLGDEVEIEVELEIEGEAAEPDDEGSEEPDEDGSEPDDEESEGPDDGESEEDDESEEPDDDESERDDDQSDDSDDDESEERDDDEGDEETLAPEEVPTSATFSVDHGDGTVADLLLTKEEYEADAEEAEFEAEARGTHTYAATGVYTLTVTATPDVGEPVTASVEVTVVEEPVAYDASTDEMCPEDPLSDAGFDDVDEDSVHGAAVDCLAGRGVIKGKGPGSFAPGDELSRAQMATLLVELLEAAGVELPAGEDAFSDDDGSPHEDAIDALAAAGIVSGDGDEFDPDDTLNRGQMAALLLRALEYVLDAPITAAHDYFDDDEGSVHEGSIDAAATAGIATGRALGRFDPDAPVNREQGATFLARLLAVLATGGPAA